MSRCSDTWQGGCTAGILDDCISAWTPCSRFFPTTPAALRTSNGSGLNCFWSWSRDNVWLLRPHARRLRPILGPSALKRMPRASLESCGDEEEPDGIAHRALCTHHFWRRRTALRGGEDLKHAPRHGIRTDSVHGAGCLDGFINEYAWRDRLEPPPPGTPCDEERTLDINQTVYTTTYGEACWYRARREDLPSPPDRVGGSPWP